MKKVITILSVVICALSFVACSSPTASDGSSPSPSTQKALDLSGEWKQVNSDSKTSYQIATISKDSIEVYWIDDSASTKSLYWAGSYVTPSSAADSYEWDSTNNKDKTASAMLASGDDTKTFTYKNGQIS
ncbi:MAG: hypothetical protein EOM14_02385, partial [Clostridia bacterium]|nr:hypothetical protein [Clostridia bacterium]